MKNALWKTAWLPIIVFDVCIKRKESASNKYVYYEKNITIANF